MWIFPGWAPEGGLKGVAGGILFYELRQGKSLRVLEVTIHEVRHTLYTPTPASCPQAIEA